MSKQKHLHAILATITVALEYDPQDLAALTTLNAQVRQQAQKLTGFRDIKIALGKIPAPHEPITEPLIPAVTPAVEMPMVEDDKPTTVTTERQRDLANTGTLDVPSFLKRK